MGISTPTALIDLSRLEANIERMAEKARRFSVALRPHIKTHKCIEIGKMQERAGATGITVSTLAEAYAFADAGFKDITYAVPITQNKIKPALALGMKINLNLLVDHESTIEAIASIATNLSTTASVMMKVDCGYHRCGVDPKSIAALNLAQAIVDSDLLQFNGILTHAGHSYNASTPTEVKEIARQEQEVMVDFAENLESEGIEVPTVSIGSTPTISISDEILEGITEIRPGNYVFFDWTQVSLRSCRLSDCAFTILSTVVGDYGNHLVIDAGATGLSKDTGPVHITNEDGFGRIYQNYERGVLSDSARIISLSQEHGKVTGLRHKPGATVRILPNHSCLTANLYDAYAVMKENEIVTKWKVRNEKTIPD